MRFAPAHELVYLFWVFTLAYAVFNALTIDGLLGLTCIALLPFMGARLRREPSPP